MKVPVVVRDDYTMFLEVFEGMLWFHTDVRSWTNEVKKDFIKDLNTLHNLVSIPLLALVDNIKLAKFVKIIGFKYEQPFKGRDNEIYQIYSRSI